MEPMSATLEVSHPDRALLKDTVFANMPDMSATLEVFHCDMSLSKAAAP